MKKIYLKAEYKTKNKKRIEKKVRRKLKSKFKLKEKNRKKEGKTKLDIKLERLTNGYDTVVTAPKNFSLVENPQETIKFVNRLEGLYLKSCSVFVNLKDIVFLDYSAVTILVSVMFSFKTRNIEFNGNFPDNYQLKKLLVNSDFFKCLGRNIQSKIEYSLGKENQILTRANKEVDSELGYLAMAEATTTIWGEKRTCKGLQRTLLELMQNTNNHARVERKGEEHWWLSVNHNKKEQKVSFIFIDYGVGIFESLKNKPQNNKWFGWFEKIKTRLIYGDNTEIFKLLLNGEMHLTVTGQHFRGKGLPGIKEVLDRKQISNLKIISNDVFSDISEGKYIKLNNGFSGTFVSWELNRNNINQKWIE